MSFKLVDLAILERRISALESALTVTLLSLENSGQNAKNDVVFNLELHATENPDPSVKAAFSDLANKIKNLPSAKRRVQ